ANGVAQTKLLYPRTPGQAPAVFGRVDVPGATKTIALYAHYDGQPVDPSKWAAGLHPFKPTLAGGSIMQGAGLLAWDAINGTVDANWRIYARGASDDKAGVFSIIEAYAALRAIGKTPACNLIFFFEGEEEAGSDHLPEIFDQYKDLLRADAWVICDGPVHASGRHQLVHGVRGDTRIDLIVHGPRRPLHSGHYGNWIPNPAMELARLLASMKNTKGEVTIQGFYDDMLPITAAERKAIAAIPPVEQQLQQELGVRRPEREMPSKQRPPSTCAWWRATTGNASRIRSSRISGHRAFMSPNRNRQMPKEPHTTGFVRSSDPVATTPRKHPWTTRMPCASAVPSMPHWISRPSGYPPSEEACRSSCSNRSSA
ncbi:MAG: M20/M25/M40 family metallo-hydrolase, partial [Chitinophagaceae bacterium]|nr:M20/M25/M40 family metallo-hydrolase [Chitinophagaceae bacterium]